MLPGFCQDSVTVRRAPLVERRGTKVSDWSQATEHEVPGCSLQEGTTATEFDSTQRDSAESGATLFLPPGADVQEGDRISFSGRTWVVDGVPSTRRSPTGRVSHVSANLKEWRG